MNNNKLTCFRCSKQLDKDKMSQFRIQVSKIKESIEEKYDLQCCFFCWSHIDKFLSRGGARPDYPRYPVYIDDRMLRMVEVLFHELELLREEDCKLSGEEFIPLYRKYGENK